MFIAAELCVRGSAAGCAVSSLAGVHVKQGAMLLFLSRFRICLRDLCSIEYLVCRGACMAGARVHESSQLDQSVTRVLTTTITTLAVEEACKCRNPSKLAALSLFVQSFIPDTSAAVLASRDQLQH
jgi:hypothetical protein